MYYSKKNKVIILGNFIFKSDMEKDADIAVANDECFYNLLILQIKYINDDLIFSLRQD